MCISGGLTCLKVPIPPLFKEGAEKIRKKLGEEAIELILARDKDDIIFEAADLIYHLLVLLESADIPLEEVFAELAGRAG